MSTLRVQIVRFVDEEPQPGVVEAEFHDSLGRAHQIIDKTPLFTAANLWSDSEYPQPGSVDCKILERVLDSNGADRARVVTLESTNGQSEFIVDGREILD